MLRDWLPFLIYGFLALAMMHQGAPAAEVTKTASEAKGILDKLNGIPEAEGVVRVESPAVLTAPRTFGTP